MKIIYLYLSLKTQLEDWKEGLREKELAGQMDAERKDDPFEDYLRLP